MSHHVAITMPDGRRVIADYRQPVVHVMRRILGRGVLTDLSDRQVVAANDRDLALISEALEHAPEMFCISTAGCTGHGPAEGEIFTPPPYKRPVIGGLW